MAGLLVRSLVTSVDEILVSYVATDEIDDRPVYDHKTGERLSPHLVKVGRQTEHDAMTRHQLFERVPIAMARGKNVRCQWLDEMKEGANGPFVRSRLVAMEVVYGLQFDTFAGLHLSNASRSSSQELRQSRTREEDTHVCLHKTTPALRSGMHCCQGTSRLRCIRRVVKKKRDTSGT